MSSYPPINNKIARNILGFTEYEELTESSLKRQYRKMALIYHPDKNPGINATSAKFQSINEAYTFLLPLCTDSSNDDSVDDTNDTYAHLLFRFLKNFNRVSLSDMQTRIFYMILEKITGSCKEKILHILGQLDKTMLMKMFEIFKEHQEVFHFSSGLMDEIAEILRKKIERTESIILNPFLEDLLEYNLYKLTVEGIKYIIPLWHNELVYDHSGNDLHILCNPILPEHIYIDAKNNIQIQLHCKVEELWKFIQENGGYYPISPTKNEKHTILIPGKSITFDTGTQMFLFGGRGIPRIDPANIYNVDVKGDIIVYLTICK